MASFLHFCVVLILANIAVMAFPDFKVGDSTGWIVPTSNDTDVYSQWASKIRFQVGDSLYFEYKNDSVLVVDKRGYYHCVTTNPISNFSDGRTIFKLDKGGLFYFISGTPNHCKNGQRLIVDVMTPHPSPDPHRHPNSTNAPPSPAPLPSSAISLMVSSPTILLAFVTLGLLFLDSALLQ